MSDSIGAAKQVHKSSPPTKEGKMIHKKGHIPVKFFNNRKDIIMEAGGFERSDPSLFIVSSTMITISSVGEWTFLRFSNFVMLCAVRLLMISLFN